MGFHFPSLPLRFLPFLNFSHVFASQLFVEFMDSLDDVQIQLGRWLGLGLRLRTSFGLRFRLGFNFSLGFSFDFRLRLGFTFALRLDLSFWL